MIKLYKYFVPLFSYRKKDYIKELEFCLKLWETKGSCTFGRKTKCEQCVVPYLLLKFISGEVLHRNIKRLTLEDWKEKFNEFKN